MRVKTSELEGAALDWAVAKALGAKVIKKARFTNFGEDMELFDWLTPPVSWWADRFHPSANWSQGGLLIDRYKVEFATHPDGLEAFTQTKTRGMTGKTHLIAAMRAIVAAELGDEVDVPEELCSE
jgi:hypothetical protein